MKIITDLSAYSSPNRTFVTIGTFDGIHIGHRKVLKNLVVQAKEQNAVSVLLTFFPHPRMVLQEGNSIKLLNTIDERIELLSKCGVDVLIVHKFSKDFADQSALTFVSEILVGKLNISKLFIGYDHHFGKNREGNFDQLKTLGDTYDFKVKKIAQKDIDNIAISSTQIRQAVLDGNIEKANAFLGYPYMLTGVVVRGENLGEKLGYPTANIHIKEPYKLLPKLGAYLVKARIEGKTYFGMMNIGYRPTVEGRSKTIEVHFFNFDSILYGKDLRIDVLTFLRDEKKFDSLEALKEQLREDKKKSLAIIAKVSDI